MPTNCEIAQCGDEGRHRWEVGERSLLVCDKHWAVIEDANAGRVKGTSAPCALRSSSRNWYMNPNLSNGDVP